MGVNFNPFSNSLISSLVNFLEDIFTICISVLFANGVCLDGCLGTKNHPIVVVCHCYLACSVVVFSCLALHSDCSEQGLVVLVVLPKSGFNF